MEATHNTLQIIQNYVKTPSIDGNPKTIKMEDITSTPSGSLLEVPTADSTSKGAESKPVKKRKSWGQVLPEPKTSLPPRKRAKTADEKEQRRIERVKRNRLAAHNSRERKRQEVEALSERNAILEQHMKLMQQQIDTYRALYPDAKIPALPKIEFEDFTPISYDSSQATPAPTTQFIHEVSTPAPFSSPDSLLSTIDSPADTAPSTPGTTVKDEFDRTQQSAVSVGFFPLNLGGNDISNGKLPPAGPSHFDHSVQLQDLHDDGSNPFFDFALFPDDANSFFNESFDGSAARDGLAGGDAGDALEPLDGASLFDLQPSAGALLRSCDATGIATE